jgi:hypothetical protein
MGIFFFSSSTSREPNPTDKSELGLLTVKHEKMCPPFCPYGRSASFLNNLLVGRHRRRKRKICDVWLSSTIFHFFFLYPRRQSQQTK